MKLPKIHYTVYLVCLLLGLTGCVNTTKEHASPIFSQPVFPPVNTGSKKSFVNSPTVKVNDKIQADLGGAGIADMIKPSMENYLFKSGRFEVSKSGQNRYEIECSVTNFRYSSEQSKIEIILKKIPGYGYIENTIKDKLPFEKVSPEYKQAFANFLNDNEFNIVSANQTILINCTMSVQIFDKENKGNIVAVAEIPIEELTSINDMKFNLKSKNPEGDFIKSDSPVFIIKEYNTAVLMYAFHKSLCAVIIDLNNNGFFN